MSVKSPTESSSTVDNTNKQPNTATSKGVFGTLLSIFSKAPIKQDLTTLPPSILKKFESWTNEELKKHRSLEPKKDISEELRLFVDLTFQAEKDQTPDQMIHHYATEFFARLATEERRANFSDEQVQALNVVLRKPVVDAYIVRKSEEYKKLYNEKGIITEKPDTLLQGTDYIWDFIINDPVDNTGEYLALHYPKTGDDSDKNRIPRALQKQFIDAIFPDFNATLDDFKNQGRILIDYAHREGFCKSDTYSIETADYMLCLKTVERNDDFKKACDAFKRWQTLGRALKLKHPQMTIDPKKTIQIGRPENPAVVQQKPLKDLAGLRLIDKIERYEQDGNLGEEYIKTAMQEYPHINDLYYHIWNQAANVEKIDTSGDADWGKTHCFDSVERFMKALKAHLNR